MQPPKSIDEPALTQEVRTGLSAQQLLEGLAPVFDHVERQMLSALGQVRPADRDGLYHVRCRLEGLREARTEIQRAILRGKVARKKIELFRRALAAWERMTQRAA